VTSLFASSGVYSLAALLLEGGEGDHATGWLGLPMWVWQLVNLGGFIAVLLYFVARPLTASFRKRQADVEERRAAADKHREEVQRLSAEIRERTARLEKDIEEIRREGVREGEAIRAELEQRAKEEAARVEARAGEEIQRRLAEAKAELRRDAAALTAKQASEILAGAINDEDRRKLIQDEVERLKGVPQ
jgi:F-type H+-transporting ATPase subunit b